jgi:ABC-2 type transport system permease protein
MAPLIADVRQPAWTSRLHRKLVRWRSPAVDAPCPVLIPLHEFSERTSVGQATARGRLDVVPRPMTAFRRDLNLLRELSLTQFKLKYTGSILGYLWSLFKPAMLFGIMYLIFAKLLGAGKGSVDFPVQLLVGIVVWTFFVEATSTAMNSVAAAGGLILKAYFPRWILVLASTLTALLTFLINAVLILVITVPLGQMHLGLRSLAAPLLILELLMFIIGLALLLSSLFVFFRDLGHIWEILTLVLFYGSGIVFPITLLAKHRDLQTLVGLNPVYQIVEDLRHALVTPTVPWMTQILGGLYVVPLLAVGITFALGVFVFTRLTPRFAEYV